MPLHQANLLLLRYSTRSPANETFHYPVGHYPILAGISDMGERQYVAYFGGDEFVALTEGRPVGLPFDEIYDLNTTTVTVDLLVLRNEPSDLSGAYGPIPPYALDPTTSRFYWRPSVRCGTQQ